MDVVAAVAARLVAHPRPRIAARAHARQRDRAIRARVAATARIARAARALADAAHDLKKIEENNQN